MAQKLADFLLSITNSPILSVILVSAFPLVELKGAIPIGAKMGIDLFGTAGLAYLGSTLVCIPVFFLLIPIFKLLKKIPLIKNFVERVESVLYGKARKISLKTSGVEDEKLARKIMTKALLVFVAVPFPVTGVWTGTAIAAFLGFSFFEMITAISIGNLIAGAIITLLTLLFKEYVDYIIYGLVVIAVIMLIIFIIKVARAKPSENDASASDGTEQN